MLKKTICAVITFDDAVQAMAAEKLLQAHGLPGRLIPVPREITAGCGLAWKAPKEFGEEIAVAMTAGDVLWGKLYIMEV